MTKAIVIKQVKNLTKAEFAACYSLNLRNKGAMQDYLVRARHEEFPGHAIMLKDEGRLLGWSLVFNYKWENGGKTTAYFYVRHSCRRHGYGKVLMRAVTNKFGKVVVEPWTTESIGFFTSFPHKFVIPGRKNAIMKDPSHHGRLFIKEVN